MVLINLSRALDFKAMNHRILIFNTMEDVIVRIKNNPSATWECIHMLIYPLKFLHYMISFSIHDPNRIFKRSQPCCSPVTTMNNFPYLKMALVKQNYILYLLHGVICLKMSYLDSLEIIAAISIHRMSKYFYRIQIS